MIRFSGASALSRSLSHSSLRYLNLSFNPLGRNASCLLGSSILSNKTLEELHISNCSIDPIGAFTILVGVLESNNKNLKFVDLDHNTIGALGGRMLMRLAMFGNHLVDVSCKQCDIVMEHSDVLMKIEQIEGIYELDMSDSYHRAILITILDVVARNPTLGFSEFSHSIKLDGAFTAIPLEKKRVAIPITDEKMQHRVHHLQATLKVAQDTKLLEKVFDEFDIDHAGVLERDKFRLMMKSKGFEMMHELMDGLLATMERSGSNVISLDEIEEFAYVVRVSCEAYLSELTTRDVFSSNSTKHSIVNRFDPPLSGRIRVNVQRLKDKSGTFGALTKHASLSILRSISLSSNPQELLLYALNFSKLFLAEAELLFGHLKTSMSTPEILAYLLPSMAMVAERKALIHIHIKTNDLSGFRYLRHLLGNAYNPLLGVFSGYYNLDLSKPFDRLCLRQLIDQSIDVNKRRAESNLADTSQNRDWNSFRNVKYSQRNVSKQSMDYLDFTPMPSSGHVEFDFVDLNRPVYDLEIKLDSLEPVSELRLTSILHACSLIRSPDQAKWFQCILREMNYYNR